MSKIDLHLHSRQSSDGEFSAEEIVLRAKKLGMELIAIADHDTVSAIDDEKYYAEKYGVKCISACEISAVMDCGVELHVLGYNIDNHDERFINREKRNKEIYRKRADINMDAALNLGFKFDKDKCLAISNDGMVTSEMIGETILNDPRNDNDERLVEYRPGGSKSANPGFSFYKDYYAYGKVCHNPEKSTLLSLKDTSEWIHSCGGFMVLAHPGHNIKHDLSLLDEICKAGLDGLEVYSSYHNEGDVNFFYEEAKKRNLIMTVGSDFHGHIKPAIEIGSIDCDEKLVLDGLNKFIKI